MKQFNRFALVSLLCTFLVLEFISRLFIDPLFFWRIDTYKDNNQVFKYSLTKSYRPERVNFLFIGSSRVNAAVNEELFCQPNTDVIAVNAARGYTTGGTHYAALQDCIRKNPDYLKDAKVFIELPGVIYAENFSRNQYTVYEKDESNGGLNSMSHLLIPYFRTDQLTDFYAHSSNSLLVKTDFTAKFLFAFYRSVPFVKEIRRSISQKLLANRQKNNSLTEGGGIKVDEESIMQAKIQAIKDIDMMISNQEPLRESTLDSSLIYEMYSLIQRNGGKLYLFEVPMHSMLNRYNETLVGRKNCKIFDSWVAKKRIPVLTIDGFTYSDSDFPDFWHLSSDRRDNFTDLLYRSYLEYENSAGIALYCTATIK
jgi:hypothetical protein